MQRDRQRVAVHAVNPIRLDSTAQPTHMLERSLFLFSNGLFQPEGTSGIRGPCPALRRS